jgi:hypothetical protein
MKTVAIDRRRPLSEAVDLQISNVVDVPNYVVIKP